MSRRTAPRGGFTMIELLVVIAIIAILVSLLSVVVIRVRAKAKGAAAAAEMAQITNAVGAFKAKMNVGFIPAGGGGPNGGFRLCSSYLDATNNPLPWAEVIYLKQVFPGMNLGDNGLRIGGAFVSNGIGAAPAGSIPGVELDPNQTLVLFLTGGTATDLQGFSTNRAQPFTATPAGSSEPRIGPFLDFPASKYASTAAAVTALHASANASPLGASLLDPWGSPYAYFAFNPGANGYMGTGFTFRGVTVAPYVDSNNRPLNQKSFQLISAGENGQDDPNGPYGFGPGGFNNVTKQSKWTPQANEYAEGQAGADDLSNFNNGPLIIQN